MTTKEKGRVIPVQTDSPAASGREEEAKPAPGEVPKEQAAPEGAEDLESLLAKKEEELADTRDRLLRMAAEFENYKKRIARENEDFRSYALSGLAKDILPVVDNLDRALASAETPGADLASLAQGVSLTRDELVKVLEKFGVSCVEAMGCQFDPNFHQALSTEACADQPENTVVRELQKGYTMKDRLLRPSLVVVSTGEAKE